MRPVSDVLDALKQQAVTILGGAIKGFWAEIEAPLRDLTGMGADYSRIQRDREAAQALRMRAVELETRFAKAIAAEFDGWGRTREAAVAARSLSLMPEGVLEARLAAQQVAETLDQHFMVPLAQTGERLAQLALRMGIEQDLPNPLRPDVALDAFAGLFDDDDLTANLRNMAFSLFAKRLPPALTTLYEQASAILNSPANGLPPLRSGAPVVGYVAVNRDRARVPMRGDNGAGWIPDGGLVQGTPVPVVALDPAPAGEPAGSHAQVLSEALAAGQALRYRDLVREQLHAWRRRVADEPGGAAAQFHPATGAQSGMGQDGMFVLGTDELLSVASLLQGEDPEPYARALAGEDSRPLAQVIRHRILSSVREIGFDPEKTSFSSDEEDAIDLIGILFQSLFEANDLLYVARDLYGRLVLPYLKVALTDDSLFNRRSHPARQLLDVLTEACDGNTGETPQDRETLLRAEQVVGRVVEEYLDDQAIFELAAQELREQLDQQRRRAELAEKRAAEAIHGRERLQHARREASAMVASRLHERRLTSAVAHFLDKYWRHHLSQTWLRDGADSERHRAAIAVGDAMVRVDADAAEVRGSVVAEQLLALQGPLAECYASCGMDSMAAREAMARVISALALPDSPRSVHVPQFDDVEQGADARVGLKLVGGTDTLDFDPAIAARMRRLRVGQGLRLIDAEGHESVARIAWISPLTGRFLIVNRRGVRKLVVSAEELACMVGAGQVLIRTVDAPFDEAMRQLWQRLSAAHAEGERKAG